MTAPALASAPLSTGGDELTHWHCCNPSRALCGADLTDSPEVDEDADCVVCVDLEDAPCSSTCDWIPS